MLRVTLEPDTISGWRLTIEGELLLGFLEGVYADLPAALRVLAERADTFEHSAELARVMPR